jgi:hypothetical protein
VVILIVVGVLVGAVGLAALYDYRAGLRGQRVGTSLERSPHYQMPRMFLHRYATRECIHPEAPREPERAD